MADKRQGLRLTLPGAPDTPHTVPGVPGLFHPSQPTPVGGVGELTIEAAKELAADEGCPLELVDIPEAEVPAAEEQAEKAKADSRKGQRAAQALGARGAEASQVGDERAATSGVKEES